MKRKIISALLMLILSLNLIFAVSALGETLIYDGADLLTAAEEVALNDRLAEVSQAYNAQIVVMTAESANGDVDQYVNDVYDSMGLGYGANKDGVLLLVVMDTRDYRILSNGYASQAIDEIYIGGISDMIVNDLSEGNYAAAFSLFADECAYYLDGYLNGFPFNFGFKLVVFFVIGLIIALIVTAIMKGQLKSVHRQNRADDYVRAGSMRLTNSSDLYLYKTVTRVKRQESNSSSGSSGGGSSSGRCVGGGKF